MSILVTSDFSENSSAALKSGVMLSKVLNKPLRLLHVVDFAGDDNAWRVLYETPDEIEKHATIEATNALVEFFEAHIPPEDRVDYTTSVRFGTPGEGIMAETQASTPDLVIAGTVGQSRLQHMFFGRTTSHLVRETQVPVIAVPPGAEVQPYKSILVAVDFSECSRRAVQTAVELGKTFDAKVEVIHAVDVESHTQSLASILGDNDARIETLVEQRSAELKSWIAGLGLEGEISAYHMKGSRPDNAIVEQGQASDADLIIMGTHGRQGFARWFLGSTAERVLRSANRPVLVVSSPENS